MALAQRRVGAERADLLEQAVALLAESLRRGRALTDEAASVADLLSDDDRATLMSTCLETMRAWGWLGGWHRVQPLMSRWSYEQRCEALAILRRFADQEDERPPRDEVAAVGRLLRRADLLDVQETYTPGALPDASATIRDLAYAIADVHIDPDRDIWASSRAVALARLARYLDDEARTNLAERALELASTDRRQRTLNGERLDGAAHVLAELAAIGDDAYVRKLLVEAVDIDNDETRTEALAKLAPRFARLAPTERDAAWCHLLRSPATRGRAALLTDLTAMRAAIAAVADRDPARDIERVLAEVVVAWP